MKITSLLCSLLGLSVLCPNLLCAAPTPTVREAAVLPEIWQKIPASQRLTYLRAAEMDSLRILAERVAGISLDGETSVRDLAAASDTIRGELAAVLRGVHTTNGPTWYEDGRVEVVRAVKIESLIQSIIKKGGGASSISHSTQVDTIDALGNAAIPGSLGHKRIMAKRAAEIDVYRRLAERAAGVSITSSSTLKDFVVKDDSLKASFSHAVKSAEITSIAYNSDGTASVEATLKIGPLVRTIVKHKSAKGETLKVEESTEQMSITEIGNGAAAEEGGSPAPAPVTQEVDTIISDVLGATTTL